MNKISGIYEIKCIETNKVYIGSSHNIYLRWSVHRNNLKKNKHHNCYLQRVWNIYGGNSFTFRILEECEENQLLIREDYHIKKNNSYSTEDGYNLSKKPGSPMAGLTHTAEAKQKMSKVQTGRKHSEETKAKIGNGWRGRKATPEQIEKNRLGHLGLKLSESTRKKLSESHKNPSAETRIKLGNGSRGKKHSPERIEYTVSKTRKTYKFINPLGEVVTIFGIGKFCRDNGLQQSEMSRVNLGKRNKHQGWTRYLETEKAN